MQTPFNVIETQPLNDMREVDINQTIEIKFSHELNTKSVEGNIFLLRNFSETEIDRNDFNIDFFEKVQTKMSYKNQTIFLQPINQLETETEYIIYVANQVKNSIDDFLFKDLITNFNTSYEYEYKSPKIISPEFGQILRDEKLLVKFYNLESNPEAYKIEISTDKFFENVVLNEAIENTLDDVIEFQNDEYLKEGNYYFRVKAINGLYSETRQFFSKFNVAKGEYLGSENEFDVADDIVIVDEVRLVETFPDNGFSNVSTNLNIIYFKFLGRLTFEEFDINNSNVIGNLIDMNDLYDGQLEHGEVQGNWEIVYDQRSNHSYLIYNLNEVV